MKRKVENFILFYKGQELGRRRLIREQFVKRSQLSYPGWYSKMRRKVFSALELEALEQICETTF